VELTPQEQIRLARENREITQRELGRRIGYSRQAIGRLEKGTKPITPDIIAAVAVALNAPELLAGHCINCPVAAARRMTARRKEELTGDGAMERERERRPDRRSRAGRSRAAANG